jgi:hypothetical protein
MPTYMFCCEDSECEIVQELFFTIASRPDSVECIACGKSAKHKIAAPMVMRASYPDGVKRRGFADLKEAAKLNKQAAGLRSDQRGEIQKEIRKMKVDISKENK